MSASRITIIVLVALFLSPCVSGAVPEEIRVSALGSSAVTFEAEFPLMFLREVHISGDVNGDGLDDIVLKCFDNAADRNAVLLVHGRQNFPEVVDPSSLGSGVVRLDVRIFPSIAVADFDRDGFADLALSRLGLIVHGGTEWPAVFDPEQPPGEVHVTRRFLPDCTARQDERSLSSED